MKYCRDLKFDEKPDYSLLRRRFKDLFNRMGYEFNYIDDWDVIAKQEKKRLRQASAGKQRPQRQFSQPPQGRANMYPNDHIQ